MVENDSELSPFGQEIIGYSHTTKATLKHIEKKFDKKPLQKAANTLE